jgi:NAD-dependent dihydropyrimidine dehydrogenase PreA subunit
MSKRFKCISFKYYIVWITKYRKLILRAVTPCPSKAILLIKFKNDLSIPYVREHLCIGCGACEKTCPASPHKAIYVEGFEIHRTAEKPKGLGNQWKSEGDFPF